MFTPKYYQQTDLKEIKEFLVENSFGILVNQVDNKPWATHIPLELTIDEDGSDILVGHIARANPQGKHFSENNTVLCIFNGPHSYISSSWYKEEEVPTWNYIAVHVYGKLSILSEKEVMASMHKLVNKYEKKSKNPISLNDMSDKTLRQVKGVIGFKIKINDIQATYKLSQTRPEDHEKIIDELEASKNPSACAIAQSMKKNTPKN
ncbi:FMN-binding negative transcriptional regulator [Cellulophaga sp. E16_2]|uniref:FMN-binding negative transcriptional regulator n=1 Tax=Cellulophaga sp. E16_2 TaxID=2789297 RepID=UPI001A91462B|nr:FMN-binding negative transcriptional regulator [Cellulophaga sp. E16_2]MBO0592380.1 FMN-binding negative transcriptional regulator [Cellulophaga sp. E16_2]